MFSLFVNEEGGLTTAGYAASIIAAAVAVLLVFAVLKQSGKSFSMSVKQLTICSIAVALAYVTSYMKLFSLPYGGSVTFFSMLFIVLIGYWYGVRVGVLTGLVFGILQFLQEPYVLSFFQVCCDYILAYAALGLGGLFKNSRKNGIFKAYLFAIIMRGAFHSLGGYLYWMEYMPENFPQSLASVYPLVYNYSFILLEGVITMVVIALPPVAAALAQVRKMTFNK